MPIETAAGSAGFAAAKYGLFAKILAIAGAGTVGALVIAAMNAKTKREAFMRGSVAGIVSILGAPILYALVVRYMPAIKTMDQEVQVSVLLSVAFVVGGLSWGLVGMLAGLQTILSERGAQAIAAKAGITEGKTNG